MVHDGLRDDGAEARHAVRQPAGDVAAVKGEVGAACSFRHPCFSRIVRRHCSPDRSQRNPGKAAPDFAALARERINSIFASQPRLPTCDGTIAICSHGKVKPEVSGALRLNGGWHVEARRTFRSDRSAHNLESIALRCASMGRSRMGRSRIGRRRRMGQRMLRRDYRDRGLPTPAALLLPSLYPETGLLLSSCPAKTGVVLQSPLLQLRQTALLLWG
jgi:hypothetical protein